MAVLTAKSSTIFIATDGGTQVYRALAEVPPALRRRLVQSTSSMNSATILIDDKRGREELVRALRGDQTQVQCRLVDSIRSRQSAPAKPTPKHSRFGSLRSWLEFFLPALVGASVWLFTNRPL
ncbi:MAG: hypothetical protein JO319_07220 [Acidobacteriaceae bacterium]|nr:hypothetical protein [Acidobacteriaceae bacterium]